MNLGSRIIGCSSLLTLCLVAFAPSIACVNGQEEDAVVRGKIEFDPAYAESWDGHELQVPFTEIKARFRERVTLPVPQFPKGFDDWKPEAIQEWEKNFVESEAGKEFLAKRKQMIESAHSFDVKFEEDGSFVVYDIPVGVYGIQGRVDKEIGGTKYGFEVFGQIEVLKDVDEVKLDPISVAITPLLQPKQAAPPIKVMTHDDKMELSLKSFDGHPLFLNFWTSKSPSAIREQQLVQDLYNELKPKYGLRVLSINIDDDRKEALAFIVKNKLKGSHGFTDGLGSRTIFDYGARSFPSFWLIGKDDKILMSQFEIAQAMRVKPSLTVIVSDRIEGKDAPTMAEDKPEDKKPADDSGTE